MSALRVPERFTPAQYLQWEQAAETRSEYYDGVIVAMAGGSPEHSAIIHDLTLELGAQLEGRRCQGFGSEQRVRVPACNRYYYPDYLVVCDTPQYENIRGVLTLLNPTLIVEVLSPSTEQSDRTDKWECYQTLDSLVTYVLVAQNRARVEAYTRRPDGTWSYTSAKGLDAELALDSIECRLRLARIYRRVTFPPLPEPVDDTPERFREGMG